MASMLTTSGDVFGFGSGYGYGLGDGSGFGDGGDGFGSGFGYGDGVDTSSGNGDGYGRGRGWGCGSGRGFGFGTSIGKIRRWDVQLISAFRVVAIGCRAHTVSEWERDWRTIAAEEEIAVDEDEVERLFAIVRERLV